MDDGKIALLISLLEPASFPIEDYAAALKTAGGDVQAAAEALLLPRVKSSGKRKAGTSLESWLGKKRTSDVSAAAPGTPRHAVVRASQADVDAPSPPRRPGTSGISAPVSSTSAPESEKALARDMKPKKDAFAILRSSSGPSSDVTGAATGGSKPKNAPQPALRLGTQQQLDSHGLPLTLLQSPLSPALASALYLAMMEESESKWERTRWYLAGRWVESPHTTHMYARDGGGYDVEQAKAGKYLYSGTVLDTAPDYPALLKAAADQIEPVVNAALSRRKRYPLEWAGEWKASVCGANRYDGANSGVGWHADQLTYLGPYATIASLSLGTPRAFRLRQTDTADPAYSSGKPIRTYEVLLGHNSLVLMNGGCQERFKHTVPPQKALDLFRPGWDIEQNPIPPDKQKAYTSRINITFRFYRTDFAPSPGLSPNGSRQGTPVCKCGMPTLLRADQKAKARSRLGPPSPAKTSKAPVAPSSATTAEDTGVISGLGPQVIDDDMIFFWQCQSPGQTGDLKGCGFFRILDMKAEGRGPCIGDI